MHYFLSRGRTERCLRIHEASGADVTGGNAFVEEKIKAGVSIYQPRGLYRCSKRTQLCYLLKNDWKVLM